MEALGFISFGLVEFVLVSLTIGLPVISLIDLARRKLTGTPLAIWALLICAVPVIGSVAYWIIRPAPEGNA